MQEESIKTISAAHYCSIGKVAMEKLKSIQSKMQDDTATENDRLYALLLQEISALAKNRMSVDANESEVSEGKKIWVERTLSLIHISEPTRPY